MCVCVCMQMCALVVCYSCEATPSIQKRSRIHNLKYRGGLAALVPDLVFELQVLFVPRAPLRTVCLFSLALLVMRSVAGKLSLFLCQPVSDDSSDRTSTLKPPEAFHLKHVFFSDYHGSLLNFLDTLCACLCEIF